MKLTFANGTCHQFSSKYSFIFFQLSIKLFIFHLFLFDENSFISLLLLCFSLLFQTSNNKELLKIGINHSLLEFNIDKKVFLKSIKLGFLWDKVFGLSTLFLYWFNFGFNIFNKYKLLEILIFQ